MPGKSVRLSPLIPQEQYVVGPWRSSGHTLLLQGHFLLFTRHGFETLRNIGVVVVVVKLVDVVVVVKLVDVVVGVVVDVVIVLSVVVEVMDFELVIGTVVVLVVLLVFDVVVGVVIAEFVGLVGGFFISACFDVAVSGEHVGFGSNRRWHGQHSSDSLLDSQRPRSASIALRWAKAIIAMIASLFPNIILCKLL